jgi:hypothetical protein
MQVSARLKEEKQHQRRRKRNLPRRVEDREF